ncbi:MAG: DUF6768 family protein [Saprospiraceae bacterium]
MKNSIEEIDQLIKDTLTQEEAKFYDSLNEQNLFGMVVGLFTGKNAWFIVVINIMTLVFFGLFLYCCIQLFRVESTNELIMWGFGSFVFLMGLSMMKIFIWMQMDKNVILREMKRLELQVLSLSSKLSN